MILVTSFRLNLLEVLSVLVYSSTRYSISVKISFTLRGTTSQGYKS